MRYRITVEVLDDAGVNDPVGRPMTYDTWKMSFYQSFNNGRHDEVVAAVANAVAKIMVKE